MTAIDKAWHDSFKPRFTTNHHLVYQSRGGQENGDEWTSNIVLDNEGQDIVVGGLRSRGVEASLKIFLRFLLYGPDFQPAL